MNVSHDSMITLAWSLLHFVWQGALIAAVAAFLLVACRKPTVRYLIGMGALASLFVSFAVTFAILDPGTVTGGSPPDAKLFSSVENFGAHTSWMAASAETAGAQTEIRWLAQGWLAGVFVLALRLAFGLLVIEYLRRRNLIALPESLVARFERVQASLGLHRLIRYRECALVHAPAVIGFLRPIVLVPLRALTGLSPEQLDAVIAHELGHIKRFDVLANFVQVIAETVFFFHPAVWWLNRRIRADRELCCDDIAVSVAGERLPYARALATMAAWRDTPRLAMAVTGGPLAARVARLLGVREQAGTGRAAGAVTLSLLFAFTIAIGTVSLSLSRPVLAQTAAPETVEAVPLPASPRVVQAPAPAPAPAAKPARAAKPAPAAKPSLPAKDPSNRTSYIEQLRQLDVDFDVDQLVALKVHGVTPEYIDAMRGTGLRVDADSLIAMKVHAVDPQFVARVRAQGFQPSVEQILAFRVHGISAEYINEMRAAGFDVTADELIAMKVHGVTPQLRREFEAAGFELEADQLIAARAMGVTPEFIDKARAHGFKNLTFQQLVQLRAADVL